MGKFIQMIVVLVGISLVSGLALGGLNSLTYERAANNVLKFKKIPAVANIWEGYFGRLDPGKRGELEEQFLAEKKTLDLGEEGSVVLFVLKKDDKPFAVAIEGAGMGFGGSLGVMAAFILESGDLAGLGVTTMSETPGVGTRVQEDSFLMQFRGLESGAALKVKKDGGDLDAVTGATVSSRAVAAGLSKARDFYKAHEAQIKAAINP